MAASPTPLPRTALTHAASRRPRPTPLRRRSGTPSPSAHHRPPFPNRHRTCAPHAVTATKLGLGRGRLASWHPHLHLEELSRSASMAEILPPHDGSGRSCSSRPLGSASFCWPATATASSLPASDPMNMSSNVSDLSSTPSFILYYCGPQTTFDEFADMVQGNIEDFGLEVDHWPYNCPKQSALALIA